MVELVGRRAECEALDRSVTDALAGTSRVLVLRGDAGAGKSALLSYLSERLTPEAGSRGGWRVLTALGVESEMTDTPRPTRPMAVRSFCSTASPTTFTASADIIAALWPQRCKALVSTTGYLITNPVANLEPAKPSLEWAFWYQYYFSAARGVKGLTEYRHDLGELIWKFNSPT